MPPIPKGVGIGKSVKTYTQYGQPIIPEPGVGDGSLQTFTEYQRRHFVQTYRDMQILYPSWAQEPWQAPPV